MKSKFLIFAVALLLVFGTSLSTVVQAEEVSTQKSSTTGWVNANYKYYDDGSVERSYGDTNWMYFKTQSKYSVGWELINDQWYYFDENGYMMNSILRLNDSNKHVFSPSGVWNNNKGWIKTSYNNKDSWAYRNSDGVLKTNEWYKEKGYWYYFDQHSRTVVSNSKEINNKNYLFNEKGQLIYNQWINTGYPYKSWKYSDTDGTVPKNSWRKIDNEWYYFDDFNSIITAQSREINKKTYVFNESGKMLTGNGWRKNDGLWYYFNNDNAITNQWKKLNNEWYYFSKDGEMANINGSHNTLPVDYVIDGKNYVFDSNGKIASNGWIRANHSWAYNKDGKLLNNEWLKLHNKWYYFGYYKDLVTSSAREVNGIRYLFDDSGALTSKNGWSYMTNPDGVNNYHDFPQWAYQENGAPVMNQWKFIGNKWYYFNQIGLSTINDSLKLKDNMYYFKESAEMAENEWSYSNYKYNPGWVYSGNNGIINYGWITVDNKDYFQSQLSNRILIGKQVINGKLYDFDSSGSLK